MIIVTMMTIGMAIWIAMDKPRSLLTESGQRGDAEHQLPHYQIDNNSLPINFKNSIPNLIDIVF